MRFLTTFSVLLLASVGAANAQCAGGLIVNCPAAVSPQSTDLLQMWQIGQTPHMRNVTLGQAIGVGLTPTFASPPPIGSITPATGAFTSLTATGPATIGGTLGVTGILSTAGNVSLGTGVGAGANIVISTPNGSNIVFNPQGSGNVQVLAGLTAQTLNFTSNITWTGAAEQGLMTVNNTFTGTNSGSNPTALFQFLQANVQTANTGGAITYGTYASLNLNSGLASGPVVAVDGKFSLTATSGNTGGADYVGGQFYAIASANDNGTSGSPKSGLAAINPVMQLTSGATYWAGVGAQENDCSIGTGASAQDFVCTQVVLLSSHAVSGSRDDVMFSLNSQGGGAVGATIGFDFGRAGGQFPIKTTGTMIHGQGNLGSGFTVANGIDWHLGTFTGNTWNDGHTILTGAGEIVAAKITDPATAPGAGEFKVTVVAGTTAGTCKLIARAGTSTTPVTIIDNVGSGC